MNVSTGDTTVSSANDIQLNIPKDIPVKTQTEQVEVVSSSSSTALIHKNDDDDEVAPIVQLINDGAFDEAGTMLLQMVNKVPSFDQATVTTDDKDDSNRFPSPNEAPVKNETIVSLPSPSSSSSSPSSSSSSSSASSLRKRGPSSHSLHAEDEILRLSRAIFGQLSSYQRMDFFKILDSSIKFTTFQFLRPSEQGLIIDEMKIEDAEQCITTLPLEIRLDTLQRLNYGALEKISHMLTPDEKEACDIMRSYAVNSVARSMSSLANTGMILRNTLKLKEAVAYYTDNQHSVFPLSPGGSGTGSPDSSNSMVPDSPSPSVNPSPVSFIHHHKTNGIILVRDTNNHLLGYTNFQKLLQAYVKEQENETIFHTKRKNDSETDPKSTENEGEGEAIHENSKSTVPKPLSSFTYATMESICEPVPFLLKTDDDIDEAIRLFSTQDIVILPVVSSEDSTLQGILRSKDVIQAVNTKLQSALAAAAADTGITSYSKSSVMLLVRKRIFWLLVLALINFGVSAIVGQFEEVLAQNLVLAGFIPLLAGLGGNIGAQSSALMISAVSSRDISPRGDWRRVLVKETKVGFVLCILLGLIVAVMGYIRGKTGEIALVIGASMGAVSIVSNLLGTVLPFISISLGGDPAVSSSPLITTVIDVLGITIYLAFAMVILGLH